MPILRTVQQVLPALVLLLSPHLLASEDPGQEAIDRHALAFSAILSEVNAAPITTLATGRGPSDSRELLSEWWGTESADDFRTMLTGLETGENGHRMAYNRDFAALRAIPAERRESVIATIQNPKARDRAKLVLSHIKDAPLRNGNLHLTAWDFGRYVMLCRWGYVAGYLTENEAWDRIRRAACTTQSAYTSWQEFADDYLLGREYWSSEAMRDERPQMQQIVAKLLQPGGTWNRIPWNQSLGDALPFPSAQP